MVNLSLSPGRAARLPEDPWRSHAGAFLAPPGPEVRPFRAYSPGLLWLTPRAYAPNPVGGNIFVLSYVRTTGAVLFDPALPVEDADADINGGVFVYARTFGLFGHYAAAQLVIPYLGGSVGGALEGKPLAFSGSGWGDLRGKLTVNVLGGPALKPREFATLRPDTVLGVSVEVMAPTGKYEPWKPVNIGANRWSVKPEVGFSRTHGHWYLEAYAGVWFFGDNTN